MAKTPFPMLEQAAGFARTAASKDLVLSGFKGAALAKLLADARSYFESPLLVILPEPEEMDDLVGDMTVFGASRGVYSLPPWDILPNETDKPDTDIAADRIKALRALLSEKAPVVATPMSALLQPTINPDALDRGHLNVAAGHEISPEALAARLHDARLEHVAQVDAPGQFCRRGGIADVFPLFAEKPVRLEWFGDEIDTVRFFDVSSQRSGAPIDEPVMLIDVGRDCFKKAYAGQTRSTIFSYLPEGAAIVPVHPERLAYVAELYRSGFDDSRCPLITFEEAAGQASRFHLSVVPEMEGEDLDEKLWRKLRDPAGIKLFARGVERFSGGVDVAIPELRKVLEKDSRVTIFCNNAAERQRLGEVLLEKGHGIAEKVETPIGHLSHGFHLKTGGSEWLAMADHEIFKRYTLRRTPRKKHAGAPIADFTELRTGDYVVHVVNGIAKYEGMTTLESNGSQSDYLTLRFAEDARIYVPLSHVDLVQRYVGSSDARPKLSKLGGKTWGSKKRAAEKAARDVAAGLLRMQAVRRALPGIAIPHDDEMQLEFEQSFPYEETPDQLAAISDIKSDQEIPHPMDRLLCGDVGFGKTEVAIRAAFKAVNAGKQVGVLVPTTILAEQHYRTFRDRTADYPVTVACLSRFRSPSEQKRIVEAMKDGRVDIVIGTHRILSKDVAFKDLGLIVIDEEQRFGVEHKERLKEMRASVDMLTMTATPIPRTLNMALLGLRDISNLATAPTERMAIRTRVVRDSDELIRRSILREISRGGQCFFLHNRVHNIDAVAARLASLVPEARFGIAHGQMQEGQLLEIMTRFIEHKLDVLVCTTIIESGVDIPSVNTLFVNEADHFGLSALHQLRGRVGRYRNQAYAYFLVPKKRPVTPIAQKRLAALEEYSELGAGFRIAMRDLEIRGAGNILGLEQSGHIHGIGFDLYCRILEKSVAEFRGETVEEIEPVELDLGTRSYIPTEYINDDSQRVDLYRKLSAASDLVRIKNLADYLRDRYGPVPESVQNLFSDQLVRNRAADLGVSLLGRTDCALVVGFTEKGRKHGAQRLRTLRRKVTPMEGARWRVSLNPAENNLSGIMRVVDEILKRLADSVGGEAAVSDDKLIQETTASENKGDKLDKIEIGKAKPKSRRTQELDTFSSAMELPSSVTDKKHSENIIGAKVIGVEPNEPLALLNALIRVDDEGFDARNFGSVTLLIKSGKRHFLRYTGTARAPSGQIGLTLRAGSSEEVREIANDHLSGGGTLVIEGVVE